MRPVEPQEGCQLPTEFPGEPASRVGEVESQFFHVLLDCKQVVSEVAQADLGNMARGGAVAAGGSIEEVHLAEPPEVVRGDHEVEHRDQGWALAVKDLRRHWQQDPLRLHGCGQQVE